MMIAKVDEHGEESKNMYLSHTKAILELTNLAHFTIIVTGIYLKNSTQKGIANMLKKLGIFLLVFAMLASIAVAGFAAENETAGLVVDVAELKAGDQIVIVAKSEDVAMSTTT